MVGHVKSVISNKLFGFVRDDGGNEYFFHREDFNGHWDDLVMDFEKGANKIIVEFEGRDTPKGKRASAVERLDHPNNGR